MSAAAQHVDVQRIALPRDLSQPQAGAADAPTQFGELVRRSLDGPVLRYSQRLGLVRTAQKMGIGRFEANLIIARVLHEEGKAQEVELRPAAAQWPWLLGTFLVVQGAIVAGVWWLFSL